MSWTRAIEVTASVHSLTEPSIIECECASMMPGMTNLPAASMTRAFAPACRFGPTPTILPPRTSRSAFSRRPRATVRMVALRTSVSPPRCAAEGVADAAAGRLPSRLCPSAAPGAKTMKANVSAKSLFMPIS